MHPIGRPVQVYLDSSDYSDFSRERRLQPPLDLKLLDFLLAAVQSDQVCIRYSIVHVIEACHRDSFAKNFALARAATMQRLSGRHVMKSIGDIIEHETRGAPGQSHENCALDDNGRWYPDPGNLGKELRRDMSGLIKDEFSRTGANRKARRFVNSQLAKNSRFRALTRAAGEDSSSLRETCLRHGIPSRAAKKGLFNKIFDEHVSEQQLTDSICEEVFCLENFMKDYVDVFERDRAIRDMAQSLGTRLVAGVATLQESLSNLRKLATAGASCDISELRKEYSSQMGRLRRELMVRGSSTTNQGTSENCAGIDTLVSFIESWFASLFGGSKVSGRKPKVSDGGDALHVFYLPYVDVWRGDAFAATAMAAKARSLGTVVVQHRRELLPILRTVLGNTTRSPSSP